ncbi:hypothetical protein IU486_21535 [Streptomyces gardneri]|nr:hypothetical protein [Nocardia sputi]MBF6167315.1 hypothetical protein [Streptomyces gardneri]MBF6204598.1 hypothetical protein [Streptomyces gardneri]
MNSDEPDDRAPSPAGITPPDPRPHRVTTHGTLLGHLILHSTFQRPR